MNQSAEECRPWDANCELRESRGYSTNQRTSQPDGKLKAVVWSTFSQTSAQTENLIGLVLAL